MKGIGKGLALAILPILLLASMTAFLTYSVEAAKVTTPQVLEWNVPNGEAVHASLLRNPEWLKVHTMTRINHETWIHVLGKDAYGQNVEAKTCIPPTDQVELDFPLVDWTSQKPVTFSQITDVYQEGGEHCNAFQIHTLPEPEEDYLGVYHLNTGYVVHRIGEFPVEPSNPDPLKVAVNWVDANGNGVPQDKNGVPEPGEFPNLPTAQSTITIIGLDQNGNPISRNVVINPGARIVQVDPTLTDNTWSTVCTVSGGDASTSYYIFTEPEPQRPILVYHILINDIELTFSDRNILADGICTITVRVTLLDIDKHEVHWAVDIPGVQSAPPIEINVASSGGKIQPSTDIEIPGCNTYAETWLTSDTNPRLVKVSAIAYIPEVQRRMNNQWVTVCSRNVIPDDDVVCFDGINSAPTQIPDYPNRAMIVRMQDGIADVENTCGKFYVAYITLYKGCNFISIPFVPDERLLWSELPGADQYVSKVCVFQSGQWFSFDFGQWTGDPIPICDGIGYWVKAKEDCTLVLSGQFMEAGVTPPSYKMCIGWNMVGVTALEPMTTMAYLGSLNIEEGLKLYGPVWAFRVDHWVRNPTNVYPGEALWVFTYDGILAP